MPEAFYENSFIAFIRARITRISRFQLNKNREIRVIRA
ncbi:hypothetical protein BOVA604_1487 [Bacteroides ovatus]|nr:hypothetical protein BOVA604_1487 [Bacteroides ovatus]